MNSERSVRVMHVIGGSLHGGAAKGALNLHNSLLNIGIESFILNGYADRNVRNLIVNLSLQLISKVLARLDSLIVRIFIGRARLIFSPGLTGISINRISRKYDIDVVHLHWINLGFLNIAELESIQGPVVWTVRDAWPFTGGCHVPMGCDKFKKGCFECEQLGTFQPFDLARFLYNRKLRIISQSSNLTTVAISPFLQKQLSQSAIWEGYEVEMIENSIGFSALSRFGKDHARTCLGLNSGKRIVLVGNDSGEVWKGSNFVKRLVSDLSTDKFEIVSFGRGKPYGVCQNFGFIEDPKVLSLLYSAVDVFVFPSTYEIFGKALFEAAYCGAGVISFTETGTAGFYRESYSSWWKLIELRNYDQLLTQLQTWRISGDPSSATKQVEARFDERNIATKYQQLYKKVLLR